MTIEMSFKHRLKGKLLFRVGVDSPLVSLYSYPSPIFTLQYMTTGSTGSLYSTSSGYIIKLAVKGQEQTLEKEAKIYELIATRHMSDLAPRYFGLFKDKSMLTLILSYEGHSFNSFKSLSISDRCVASLFSTQS